MSSNDNSEEEKNNESQEIEDNEEVEDFDVEQNSDDEEAKEEDKNNEEQKNADDEEESDGENEVFDETVNQSNLEKTVMMDTKPTYFHIKNKKKGIIPKSCVSKDPKKKSAFSQATNDLYKKVLNGKTSSLDPDIYNNLTCDDFMERLANKGENKGENKAMFENMLSRHKEYEMTVKGRIKERNAKKDEELEKIKAESRTDPNLKFDKKKTNDFYNQQMKFMESKQEEIKKKEEEKNKKENDIKKGNLVSKNSDRIVKKMRGDEKQEDLLARLNNEKLRITKERALDKDKGDKTMKGEKVKSEKKKPVKKSKKEIEELSNKLFKEKETFTQNKIKERENFINKQAEENEKNTKLVSRNTLKVMLEKFAAHFDKNLFECFNQRENKSITKEEYLDFIKKLGYVDEKTTDTNELVKDAFEKYLNASGDKVDTNAIMLFSLCFLGVYKGNDELDLKRKELEDTFKNDPDKDTKVQEEMDKFKSTEQLVKKYAPELDLSQSPFNSKQVNTIKKKYIPWFSNLSALWAKENNQKREEKKKQKEMEETAKEGFNNTLNKTKRSKKEEEKIESSRRRLLMAAEGPANNNDTGMQNTTIPKGTGKLKLEDIYQVIQKKKQQELLAARDKKVEPGIEECTFQPNAKTKPVNKAEVAANIEKLYLDGKAAYTKKRKGEEKDIDDNMENANECTFKPKFTEFKKDIFKENPLEQDTRLANELEKKKERRMKNQNDNENEKLSGFNCSIEPKNNREGFEALYKNEKKGTPLLKMEVNIDNTKKNVKLEIYPGDDPKKVTDQFCKKYKLGEDKKLRLQRIIQERLNANESSNENFSSEQ